MVALLVIGGKLLVTVEIEPVPILPPGHYDLLKFCLLGKDNKILIFFLLAIPHNGLDADGQSNNA